MIEPTESETQETIDRFVEALIAIDREVTEDPDLSATPPTPPRWPAWTKPEPPASRTCGGGGRVRGLSLFQLDYTGDGPVEAGGIEASDSRVPKAGYELADCVVVARPCTVRAKYIPRGYRFLKCRLRLRPAN